VYGEIVECLKTATEPLLTKDLSHVFIHVLKTLLIQPSQVIEKQISGSSLLKNSNVNLKSFIDKQAPPLFICETQKILDMLISNNNDNEGLNRIETELLNSAKLPNITPFEFDSAVGLVDALINVREQERLDLLLSSIGKLETCCDNCLILFNQINTIINYEEPMKQPISSFNTEHNDLDEFFMYLNDNNDYNFTNANPSDEFYTNEDLVDIDNDEESEYRDEKKEIIMETSKDRNFLVDSDLISFSSLMFNVNNLANKNIDNATVNSRLSRNLITTKMHRNNSFRAAIGAVGCSSFSEKENGTTVSNASTNASLSNNITSRRKTPGRRPVARSLTNSSNDFNRLSFRARFEETTAAMLSSRNQINDDFLFKKPRPVGSTNQIGSDLTKSVSMNFDNKDEMNNFTTRKRKAQYSFMPMSTSSDSLCSASNAKPSEIARRQKALKSLSTMSMQKEYNFKSSMNNLNQLTYNELSTIIKNNLLANKNIQKEEEEKIVEKQPEIPVINLETPIEIDLFSFITNIFQILCFMLPPENKRKLHFLLRFLNKMKFSRAAAKFLITDASTPDLFSHLKDLNFIDSSINESSLDHQSINHLKRRSTLKREIEVKSNAVESILVKNFTQSIVYFGDLNSCSSNLDEKLGEKLLQILINNYTEIMRVPDDIVKAVRTKMLDSGRENSKLNGCLSSYCSKVSLNEYERQKMIDGSTTKLHLANLLDNIIRDVNLSDEQKLEHLKRFKEAHPQIFEENSKLRKAMNILGLNETIAAVNSASNATVFSSEDSRNSQILDDNFESTNRSTSSSSRKQQFLGNLTNSLKASKNLSTTLNQTTVNFMNTTSSAAKNSIAQIGGLQKLFNKKKKENLI
jgi:hypothetical protein